jgi:hypothetical protein
MHSTISKESIIKKFLLLSSLLISLNLFATPKAMDHLKEGLDQMLNVTLDHKVSLIGKSGIALNHQCNINIDLNKMELTYNDSRTTLPSIAINLNEIQGDHGEIAEHYPEIEHFTVRAVRTTKVPFLGTVNSYDTISIQRDAYDSKAISIPLIKQNGLKVQRRVCNFQLD